MFNYEYCRSGFYDVEHAPNKVGALTDYYRRKYPDCRTHTPVFHFCVRHNRQFSLETQTNATSTFSVLADADGVVLFFWLLCVSSTFVHYAEEISDVPYRSHKIFPRDVVWRGAVDAVNLSRTPYGGRLK